MTYLEGVTFILHDMQEHYPAISGEALAVKVEVSHLSLRGHVYTSTGSDSAAEGLALDAT